MKNFLFTLVLSLLVFNGFGQTTNSASLDVDNQGTISCPSFLGLDHGAVAFYFKIDPSDYNLGTQYTILSVEDSAGDNVFAVRLGNPNAATPNWGDGIGVWSKRTFENTLSNANPPYGGDVGETSVLHRVYFSNETSASELFDGNWHHCLISAQSGSFSVNIDGEGQLIGASDFMSPLLWPSYIYTTESAFTTNGDFIKIATPDAYLDQNNTNVADQILGFPGQIDELVFYNTSIDVATYQSNYNTTDDSYCIDRDASEVSAYFGFDGNFSDSSSNSSTISGYSTSDLTSDVPFSSCASSIVIPVAALSAFPNPVIGNTVTLSPVNGVTKFKVFDGYGNQYPTVTGVVSSENFVLDISSLPAGVYGVAVKDDNGIRRVKILRN